MRRRIVPPARIRTGIAAEPAGPAVLSASAAVRLLLASGVVALLWLAVAWALT